MASLTSTFERLKRDFSVITFMRDDTFVWSAQTQTIHHPPLRTHNDLALLLHELGHALSNHHTYTQDIELIRLERGAWDAARVIATRYDTAINDEVIEEHLDSYRDWLYARSRCPGCSQPGIQNRDSHYTCAICGCQWRPNEARQCHLRRRTIASTRP